MDQDRANLGAGEGLPPENSSPAAVGLLAEAWGLLKRSYWPLVTISLVYLLISMGAGMVPLLGSIASILLMPMTAGFLFVGRRLTRGERIGVEDLFVAFNTEQYLQVLCIQFLVGLASGLAFLPVILGVAATVALLASGVSPIPGIVLLIVLLIGSIAVAAYVTGRLIFSSPLFLEAPRGTLDPIRAIRLSWQRTEPYQWMLFGKMLIFAALSVAAVFTLMLGYIFLVMPLFVCTIGAAMSRIAPPIGAHCPRCGYSREGIDGRLCPECGAMG